MTRGGRDADGSNKWARGWSSLRAPNGRMRKEKIVILQNYFVGLAGLKIGFLRMKEGGGYLFVRAETAKEVRHNGGFCD